MDIRQIQQPVKQFIRNIPPSIKVDRVLIFGSYLEGTATEESDIDVMVISDDFKTLDEEQRLDILYDVAENIEPVIHPWGFSTEELENASELTTLWYVRTSGIRFS
jgi:predicted nucleotidyltransferase